MWEDSKLIDDHGWHGDHPLAEGGFEFCTKVDPFTEVGHTTCEHASNCRLGHQRPRLPGLILLSNLIAVFAAGSSAGITALDTLIAGLNTVGAASSPADALEKFSDDELGQFGFDLDDSHEKRLIQTFS